MLKTSTWPIWPQGHFLCLLKNNQPAIVVSEKQIFKFAGEFPFLAPVRTYCLYNIDGQQLTDEKQTKEDHNSSHCTSTNHKQTYQSKTPFLP